VVIGSADFASEARHIVSMMPPQTKVSKCALNHDFGMALDRLGITERPAWPDDFGEALRLASSQEELIPTLSLFSGGGGLDIGFHDAGFGSLEAIELDSRYAASLSGNNHAGGYLDGTRVRCEDAREYRATGLAKSARFVIGGPPCQTFSAAGRRASGVLGTTDARGTLFEEYVRLLSEVEPDGFLFENVYGMTGAQEGNAWKEILKAFDDLGFNVTHRILDAADYGVPQHRERVIVVGVRVSKFKFPRPTHGPDSAFGHPFYSAGMAVEGAPHEAVPDPPNGRYGHLLRAVPPGLNYSFFTAEMGHPEPVFAWRSKFSDLLYKADPQRPTRTIKAHGGQYTGPFSWHNRPFSVAELKRLQTFPDGYCLAGGHRVATQQIGNSVPPQLARILALAVTEQVFDRPSPVPLDYMEESETLGFRKRKRALTSHYREVAARALSGAESKLDRPSIGTVGQRTRWRCLGTDFSWLESNRNDDAGIRVIVDAKRSRLRLTVGKGPVGVVIRVEPATRDGWPLPIDYAELRVDARPHFLTAAWKALEEEVRERFGYADMVQASGYYTYGHKVRGTTLRAPRVDPWPVLTQVMSGLGVGETLHLKRLVSHWGVDYDAAQARREFAQLKQLGFEVRNHRTNPQIPRGKYLIPYPFPTLTPESVQRGKHL
jgi:DNA (cytosine-5)-methyltransferase 1